VLFHTSIFVLFFILFLAVYVPARRTRAGPFVILVFSSIFYGWWSWKFLGLLWVTLVVDYGLALMLAATESPARRRLFVAVSLVTNLGILGFFKYFNFFVESAGAMGIARAMQWRIEDIVLPVGISFYIFQSLSYTIDVYRRQERPVRNFFHYAAFVCYFPQLVAGPIERLHHLLPQIVKPAPITPERVTAGAFLFAVGFFRKAIADTFAAFIDPTFANLTDASPVQVVLAVFGFGLQIYLDFTGYVDMARGVSRMIGIDLMLNFDAPYTSISIREFWRRWHISLSQWLRDYLYISLGGNRYGMPRHLANLMVTMLLGGLWHGAGVNFVIWGGLHGLYLVINTLWARVVEMRKALQPGRLARIGWLEIWVGAAVAAAPGSARASRAWSVVRVALSWLVTFLAVNYAWLYFRVPTFNGAMLANRKIGEWLLHPTLPGFSPAVILLVLLTVVMELLIRFRKDSPESDVFRLTLPRAAFQGAVGAVLFLTGLVLLAGVPTQQFIYFQF
jgi:alginate O-acetyltransferase complex protein AlgI